MEDCGARQRAHRQAYQTREKVGVESSGHEGHHAHTHHAGQTEVIRSLLEAGDHCGCWSPDKGDHHHAVAPDFILRGFIVVSGLFWPGDLAQIS